MIYIIVFMYMFIMQMYYMYVYTPIYETWKCKRTNGGWNLTVGIHMIQASSSHGSKNTYRGKSKF